jgi:hypothetical protein
MSDLLIWGEALFTFEKIKAIKMKNKKNILIRIQ